MAWRAGLKSHMLSIWCPGGPATGLASGWQTEEESDQRTNDCPIFKIRTRPPCRQLSAPACPVALADSHMAMLWWIVISDWPSERRSFVHFYFLEEIDLEATTGLSGSKEAGTLSWIQESFPFPTSLRERASKVGNSSANVAGTDWEEFELGGI